MMTNGWSDQVVTNVEALSDGESDLCEWVGNMN